MGKSNINSAKNEAILRKRRPLLTYEKHRHKYKREKSKKEANETLKVKPIVETLPYPQAKKYFRLYNTVKTPPLYNNFKHNATGRLLI